MEHWESEQVTSGNVFADIGLPNAEELKALAGMKMRGLFPTLSWKELTDLMTLRERSREG